MNINRTNYEEYFLLYADNELSAQQRKGVELFVAGNPDLEEEFIMLQQSVVKPDMIEMPGKNALLKEENVDPFIDAANYEEIFILYTDNELDAEGMEQTEKFLKGNPARQHDFNLLQKVTFEPDTAITFPDKQRLYRKEEKKRVIPLAWTYLAAALLAGLGIWTAVTYLQQKPSKNTPEVVIRKIQPEKDKTIPVEKIDDNEQPVVKDEKKETLQPAVEERLQQEHPVVVKGVDQVKKDETVQPQDTASIAVVKLKPDNGLPQQLERREPVDKSITAVSELQNNTTANTYAMPASYMEESNVKSENYVFYNITAEEFKKSKIGNFLKKVKRTIERKLPLRNNSLRLGNVEIAKDEN